MIPKCRIYTIYVAIFTLLLMSVATTYAHRLSAQEALQRARQCLAEQSMQRNSQCLAEQSMQRAHQGFVGKSMLQASQIFLQRSVADKDGQVALYLYASPVKEGFMLLSASDLTVPVLAYNTTGPFDASLPGVKAWMEGAAEYVSRAESGVDAQSISEGDAEMVAISPLMSTQWNQTDPYNGECPLSYGRRSMTGCVATAMAQILHTNRFAKGDFVRNYMDGSVRRQFDYGLGFQWDLMPDRLTAQSAAEERAAVCRLMLGAGLAVNTSYAWNESGAYNEDVPYGFVDKFGYNPDLTVYAWKSLYTDADWARLLYAELQMGRPVFYAGGIHAFVLDGYDGSGLWHFNWGWGGVSDGYYSLLSLGPGAGGVGAGSGDFTDRQLMVRAIPGDVTDALDIFHVAGSVTWTGAGFDTLFQLAGTPYNHNVYPSLIIQDAEGRRVYEQPISVVPLEAYGYASGRNGVTLSLAGINLPAGEYRIYPGVTIDASATRRRAYPMPGAQRFVVLTVGADGTVIYSNDTSALPDIPERDDVSLGLEWHSEMDGMAKVSVMKVEKGKRGERGEICISGAAPMADVIVSDMLGGIVATGRTDSTGACRITLPNRHGVLIVRVGAQALVINELAPESR